MSHNIHYIIVTAEDAEDAMRDALNEIEEWGSENNWRNAVGAFDEKGKAYTPDGQPSNHFGMEGRTLKSINADFDEKLCVPEWGWGTSQQQRDEILKTMQSLIDCKLDPQKLRKLLKIKNGFTKFYQFKGFAETIQKMADTLEYMGKRRKFNVFLDEYRSFDFDEIGVTRYDTTAKGKKFCVLIDMHS